jgi:hypothetical protein
MQVCSHVKTVDIRMPEDCKHYSKIICADCNKFLTWGKNPRLTQDHEQRKHKIDILLDDGIINTWERHFLESIKDKRIITPKQNEILERIIGNNEDCFMN